MRTSRKFFLFFSLGAFPAVAAISARGAGFDLPDLDAFAVGRGMAVTATADNPSAIYYNPAGISQLYGNNLRAGVYGIDLDPSYKSPATGKSYDNEDKFHGIPQFYYTYGRTNWPVSFGLGVYSPFGLGVKWAEDSGFRTVTGAIQSSLTYLRFNPVVAIKLLPNFSIGGGVSADYAYADLKQGLTTTPNSDAFDFKGDGWAVGYNLGALWQPHEKISIGATFRNSAPVNLRGHTDAAINALPPGFNSAASADFPFPVEGVFGISYRPTQKWNLEFDADYMDWDAVGTVTIHQAAPSPYVPVANLPVALDWQSSWYFEWGATRYFDNGWHVSAGYIFNENSVPDAHFTPAIADLDRHFLSIGTGYKGRRFDFDIAYQFGYGPTRTVAGSAPSAAGQTADGQYDFISHAVAVSVGWHF
jgi:long-chain fatty acid transport protein